MAHRILRTLLLALTASSLLPATAPARDIELTGRVDLTRLSWFYYGTLFTRFYEADGRRYLGFGGEHSDYSFLVVAADRGNGAFETVFEPSWLHYVIPTAMTFCDLDGDGVSEILYAGSLGIGYVARQGSDGQYFDSGSFPISSPYSELAAGDLDGDGRADVAAVRNDGTVRVHWNQSGSLGAAESFPSGPGSIALALADLDRDGDLDVVVANRAVGTISVLANLGARVFAAPVAHTVGSMPTALDVADFDLDGWLDVVVSNEGSATVSLLRNAGDGTLLPGVDSPTGAPCRTIEATEFDGDGRPDLVLAHPSFGIRVLQQAAAGTFATPLAFAVTGADAASIDVDQDGDQDVVPASSPVLRNRGDGTFEPDPTESTSNDLVLRFESGDVDGDGDEDLLLIANSGLRVRVNTGDGTLAAPSPAAPNTAGAVGSRVADVDSDGDLDVVLALSSTLPVVAAINQGGVFGPVVPIAQTGDAVQVEVGDVDGDGRPDIVTRTSAGHGFARNTGGATWAPFAPLPIVTNLNSIWTTADLDGDGDADFLTAFAGPLLMHENLGGLAFAAPVAVSPYGIGLLTAADLDGDGDLDLCGRSGAGLTVVRNLGGGGFAQPVVLGPAGSSILADDLDHDGDLDLLTTFEQLRVLTYENLGAGTFAQSPPAALGGAATVATIDLDRDGDEDLIGGWNGRTIVIESVGSTGTPFCAGDGSATACPCGNASALGAGLGCFNSSGRAGHLKAAGSSSLLTDTLRLRGSGMTNAPALYFQGTTTVAGGVGAVFGDGLLCVSGTVVRLGVRTNVAGQSVFPGASQPSLREAGLVTQPGERLYQVWYRDAAPFCTSGTWNLTNGLRILWTL